MPLYEYTCKDCGTPSEILVRGDEKPVCPKCQSERLEKQLSIPSVNSRSGAECRPGVG